MTMPTVTLRQLIEAGVHFGHHTRRWNPKMAPYIFGVRNNIHIIDLEQTGPMMLRALTAVRDTVAKGGRVLFIGTKRQAQASIAESAARCGQYFVNHRWLGGMMTNWPTISQSIKHMGEYEEKLSGEDSRGYTKKERLKMQLELDKWNRSLGGIRNMGGKPDIVFVLDTNKEELAIKEAQKLGINVMGFSCEGYKGVSQSAGHHIANNGVFKNIIGLDDTPDNAEFTINILGEYNIGGDAWVIDDLLKKCGIHITATLSGTSKPQYLTSVLRVRVADRMAGPSPPGGRAMRRQARGKLPARNTARPLSALRNTRSIIFARHGAR